MPEQLYKSHKDESPPMFENKFVDYFSRIHFSIVPVIYLPILVFFLYRSFFVVELDWYWALAMFFAGILTWSFFEYALHRWVFHYHPTGKLARRIHFIAHGVHHDFPNDSLRLVMPPAVSLPIAVLAYSAFHFTLGPDWAAPIFTGFGLAYLTYDMLHYAVHHRKWENPWFKRMQKHHIRHHFSDPDRGFGFTSKFWDKVFGTDFKDK